MVQRPSGKNHKKLGVLVISTKVDQFTTDVARRPESLEEIFG
jgi:hypothetical protein